MSKLKIEWWPTSKVVPYERNNKIHGDSDIAEMVKSITEFGWTQPIVLDETGVILAGHRRHLAALKMELEQVPVVVCPITPQHQVFATIRHNRARGTHGIRPMSSIVCALLKAGATHEQVMLELGMQEEEVLRLSQLRERPVVIAEKTSSFRNAWVPKELGKNKNAPQD